MLVFTHSAGKTEKKCRVVDQLPSLCVCVGYKTRDHVTPGQTFVKMLLGLLVFVCSVLKSGDAVAPRG